MAYADKCCDMRRCCIAQSGHVQWEGVCIDDDRFVLTSRDSEDSNWDVKKDYVNALEDEE